jgi:rare lipoprotein A
MNGRTLLVVTSFCLCTGIVHSQQATVDRAHGAAGTARTAASARAKAHVTKVVQRGKVSWYGPGFAGRRTASGERFDPQALTMAHRTLPLGTIVDVVNDANGKKVRVRVNDRGPYRDGRVADLSRAASKRLGFLDEGVTHATLRVVSLPPEALAGDSPAG